MVDVPSVAGVTGLQVFRANSIFDPDYTNAGHQPLYRDVYAGIYNYYAVVNSTIKVEFINSNAAVSFVTGVSLDDDTGLATAIDAVQEQSLSTTKLLTALSGSRSSYECTQRWDCVKNRRIDPFSDSGYKTLMSSNPAYADYYMIFAAALSAGTGTVNAKVTIEYNVLLTDLATQQLN